MTIKNVKQAVIIRKYDRKLPAYFRKEKIFLKKTIGNGFKIEHVGSSSVPELGGKNVIDMQFLVKDKRTAKKFISKIESAGYEYRKNGGDKYRIFFLKYRMFGRKKIRMHLHLMWKTSDKYLDYILFRNYLRKHKDEAEKYYFLKIEWARKAGSYRKKFPKLKTDYVKGVLRKAKKK